MHRPGPGGDGSIAYGGPYGGGGYGGDELACALRGLAFGGEHLPGSPYDAYAHALPAMSPRAAGQDAYNDASAHADLLFDAQDVSWLRAAYGQGFDPERLLAGEAVPAEHARQPMSPGYHRRVLPPPGTASLPPAASSGASDGCCAHRGARDGRSMARCARVTRRRLAGCGRSCHVVAALGCARRRCGAALTASATAACIRRSCAGRMRKPAHAAMAASARCAPSRPFR